MGDDPRERETGVPCPQCERQGFVVLTGQSPGTIKGSVCDLCHGAGIVSASAAAYWWEKNPIMGRPR